MSSEREFLYRDLSEEVIGAAMEVHQRLGPGLLESAYETCLSHELDLRGIRHERQVKVPVAYKGRNISVGYRIDIVVEGRLLLELKCVQSVLPVHRAQVLTYLRLLNLRVGLLLNFYTPVLKNGIHRLVL